MNFIIDQRESGLCPILISRDRALRPNALWPCQVPIERLGMALLEELSPAGSCSVHGMKTSEYPIEMPHATMWQSIDICTVYPIIGVSRQNV